MEDAEDIYQIVFQTVFERLDTLEDKAKLRPWIVSITWRQCLNLVRSRSKDVTLEDVPEIEDKEYLSDQRFSSYERRKALSEALRELGDVSAQAIIECRFYEGMSYREISRALGIPIGSIGPMLGRSLKRLRKILEQKGLSVDAL